MIVYVESNFVLEIVRQQETATQAEQFITFAEQGRITLILPIFALIEPRWTLAKDKSTRDASQQSLQQQFDQLRRSALHQTLAASLNTVLSDLRQIEEAEIQAFDSLVTRLLKSALLLDISKPVFEQAMAYQQTYSMKDFPDAIMYAAVIADLKQRNPQEMKCFLNRKTNDFDLPSIKNELKGYNCRFIGSFEHGLRFVESQIGTL